MIDKKDYRIGLYEKAMPEELSWTERLRAAKEAGFDYVELSLDESEARLARLDWDEGQIEQLRSAQHEAGLPIETMCFSAQRKYPLGSKIWEKQAMDILQKAVLFAKKAGIRIIQAQGYDCYYQETSSEETRERFYRNLEKGTMFAAMHGVMLALETMENDFMNTIEKAMYSVNRIDSPYLLVYPDIGNVTNATSDVVGDIRTGKGKIAAAHLKETRPGVFREVPYGSGHVDFPSAIEQLYKQGVRRYVAEFWYCGEENWRSILRDNRAFLDKQFEKANP